MTKNNTTEEEIDTILGDFAVQNSGEDEVLMSIDAVEIARESILALLLQERKDTLERCEKEFHEVCSESPETALMFACRLQLRLSAIKEEIKSHEKLD